MLVAASSVCDLRRVFICQRSAGDHEIGTPSVIVWTLEPKRRQLVWCTKPNELNFSWFSFNRYYIACHVPLSQVRAIWHDIVDPRCTIWHVKFHRDR